MADIVITRTDGKIIKGEGYFDHGCVFIDKGTHYTFFPLHTVDFVICSKAGRELPKYLKEKKNGCDPVHEQWEDSISVGAN